MPLGFERINERTQRPNAHINFIRPLPGPTAKTAEEILSRVAAVCYPFMKSNMVLVQALEEFPFNREFVGRNFNAGEVIQLVLRDRTGMWLPQRMIEMVMVHELAHCKQMNHSPAFWKVRNAYAEDLRALWAKGYKGEGMWGRGRNLDTGSLQQEDRDPSDMPEHVCGGTYGRRSSKKRRRGGDTKQTLTYAERKQRRILKKFGAGGQSLGSDEDTKVKLEGGVAKKGKPRVAGSARGRELRAAAALARFDTAKKEPVEVKNEETPSDSETEDDEIEFVEGGAAIDVDGKEMTDDKGRALVKICEDEDTKDGNSQREMDELQGLNQPKPKLKPSTDSSFTAAKDSRSSVHSTETPKPLPAKSNAALSNSTNTKSSAQVIHIDEIYKRRPAQSPERRPALATTTCTVCSLENEIGSFTCMACAHVLNPHMDPHQWSCKSTACKGSQYVNAGDVGRCGVCGASK
ncbi:WLM-domain-containing protein [Paraphaeosphaeria sporulosa]|uniref:WLM-domain-containing protein n=1 Tax=Paraphaeosphaeria sporulosa TaxID=1460663 RepID=A0A177CUG6_9PLEO|nr:WLM-domain-containing protein [Paraphaeosphaeria sporulosa]OAG11195.1 WLM-domain-containing protein [Paraphaeosphaeria sporulosa]